MKKFYGRADNRWQVSDTQQVRNFKVLRERSRMYEAVLVVRKEARRLQPCAQEISEGNSMTYIDDLNSDSKTGARGYAHSIPYECF